MFRSLFFYLRLIVVWYLLVLVATLSVSWIWSGLGSLVQLLGLVVIVFVVMRAHSRRPGAGAHRRQADVAALASRQRRQIKVPFEADEAFELLDVAIRELPGVERVDEHAQPSADPRPAAYADPYDLIAGALEPMRWIAAAQPHPGHGQPRRRQQQFRPGLRAVQRAVTTGCRWTMAWARRTCETIARAVTLGVSSRRRGEQAAAAQTATEKELAIAKLSLLQAQVEPHFMYDALAGAQVLVRSVPAGADAMLGHLIQYLRHSLPRTDRVLSNLGEELERARLPGDPRIRMGARLNVRMDVPDALLATPLPPMLLQTLVENAIKRGLEPRPGGGTVWIFARRQDGRVAVTVADDGKGFDTRPWYGHWAEVRASG
ncbi:sensor histidine kinase [Rhodanobacter lindaniclasticus]